MNKSVFFHWCDKCKKEAAYQPLSVAVRKEPSNFDWEVVLRGDWHPAIYTLPPKCVPYNKDHPTLIREFEKYRKWLEAWKKGAPNGRV